MAGHAEVVAALRQAQRLQAEYEGRLDAAVRLMGDRTWTGPAADRFGELLTGCRQAYRAALKGVVDDLQELLAHTPPDKPGAGAHPGGRRR